jgi:protein ImuB
VKQILCVRLPEWPIDRIKRKQEHKKPEIRNPKSESNPKSQIPDRASAVVASATLCDASPTAAQPPSSFGHSDLGFDSDFGFRNSGLVPGFGFQISGFSAPLVLVRTVASRQIVLFACDKSKASGIDPGMTLAEAGALCANLQHLEHDPQKDLQGLHRLARWMVRFSPVVAVEPPDALFLDLTGSERLFHGIDRLAQLIHAGLTRLGLHFQMAIAETPGAAWAFAEGKCSTFNVQLSTFNEEITNASLPVESWTLSVERWTFAQLPIRALRVNTDQILSFHNLGIHTIGQLMSLPRETLPARFGQTVLHRLDQALGKIPEPLVPIPHSQPIHTKIEFEGGVESLSDLWQAFKFLLEQIVFELRQRSCGARQLIAEFLLPGEAPILKTIALSRPTANLPTLWNLLRCTTETVKCGQDGFSGLKLSVPLFSRLSAEQLHLLDQEKQIAEQELDHLIERLRVRLGEASVLFPQPVESHLPEKAYELSVLGCGLSAVSGPWSGVSCKKESADNGQPTTHNPQPTTDKSPFVLIPPVDKPTTSSRNRPLHLLPAPIEIHCSSLAADLDDRKPISFTHAGKVHPLVHCNGPERITGTWWEGRNKTRDYFETEDHDGERFWIFRVEETRKWYLHGTL